MVKHNVSCLIKVTVMGLDDIALAQVRFQQGVSAVRCEMRMLSMTVVGHLLPVVARKSRQLITQKPPITERNVTLAELPL